MARVAFASFLTFFLPLAKLFLIGISANNPKVNFVGLNSFQLAWEIYLTNAPLAVDSGKPVMVSLRSVLAAKIPSTKQFKLTEIVSAHLIGAGQL